MKTHLKILLFPFVFVIMSSIGVAQAHGFKEIVVFGESSSDTGNAGYLQCPSPPDWGPWAPCTSAYYDGNLTNGPIWIEFLADRLGLSRPEPSLLGGTNHAYAGAKTQRGLNQRVSLLTGQPVEGSEVPGILSQIDTYLSTGQRFKTEDLVVIWGGANDLRDIRGPEDLQGVLDNLGMAISTVACSGAKHIVVPNQLNASVSPAVRLSGADPAQVEQVVRKFNFALRTMVANFEDSLPAACGRKAVLHHVDMFAAGEAILTLSEQFDEPYANIEDPAVNLFTLEVPDGVDPNDFLFLDTIHVTTPAQQFFAGTAYTTLKFQIPSLRSIR